MGSIDTTFGENGRHTFIYNFTSDRGKLKLWSYQSRYVLGWDSTYCNIAFHNADNIISILIGIGFAKSGKAHGFTNGNGDLIKIYPKKDIILFQKGGESNTGALKVSEAEDLELLCKDLLTKKGFSISEITTKTSI